MSLLDDLKQQANKQQQRETSGQTPVSVVNEDFYREHAKARMLAAYEFLTELANQLNEMKLDTRAEYPFKPEGKPVALMQQDYKAFNDNITDPRLITLSFSCKLVNPTSFEMSGRAAVLAQAEMLDRYGFKYNKIEQKDARQMVTSARFQLVGPLAIKVMLQVDESRQVIKLLLANFAGPGVSHYHLKPEQLDETFLDNLGKYILRQKTTLFREELSEDVRAKLRQKLQEEQHQRESELQEIEAAREAEEALRKQNSTTSQLKKAVSQTVTENTDKLKKAMNDQLKRVMQTQVAKGKESLKGIFDKLKKQTQALQQTPPVQSTPQTIPPVPVSRAEQVRVQPASAQRQIPQPMTAKAPTQPTSVSPASLKTTAQPAIAKKTQPPKVYNAPPNNPFLKPESPVEPPVGTAELEAKTATEQLDISSKLIPPVPESRAEQVGVPPASTQRQMSQPMTAKVPTQPTSVSPVSLKTATEPAGVAKSTTAVQAVTVEKTQPPKVYNAPPNNPFLKPESPVEPPVGTAELAAKTAAEQLLDTSSKLIPPVPEPRAEQVRVPPASTQRQIPQPMTAKAPTQPPVVSPESLKTAAEPAGVAKSTTAAQATKVYNAPSNNPFLKPESPVEPPVAAAELEAKTAAEQLDTSSKLIPPVTEPRTEQVRVPPASAQRQIPQPMTAKAPTQPPVVSPASLKTAAEPVGVANSKVDPSPSTTAAQAAAVEKTQASKVQNAPPPNNPLIKPELPVEPPVAAAELEAKTAAEQLELDTSSKLIPPVTEPRAEQVRVPPAPTQRQIPQPMSAKAPTQPTVVSPASLKTAAEPVGVANSKVDPSPSTTAAQAAAVEKTQASKVQNAPPPNNPLIKPELPVEPPVAAAELAARTVTEQPEIEATPVADFSSRPAPTPESLEADLARIIERDKQKMQQQTPDSNKTTNPCLQTPTTKVVAQTAMPAVASESPGINLNSGELKTGLSDIMPITGQAVSAEDATAPEAKNSTQNPFLNPGELDIDISANVVPPQNNDSKENS